jgi:GrpB-like predicted nucleotidyltransferase (UPF0157 family)
LLLRDYLRAHPDELAGYEQLKRDLAEKFRQDSPAYTDAKVPWFWETVRHTDDWAQRTGWEAGPSDA